MRFCENKYKPEGDNQASGKQWTSNDFQAILESVVKDFIGFQDRNKFMVVKASQTFA